MLAVDRWRCPALARVLLLAPLTSISLGWSRLPVALTSRQAPTIPKTHILVQRRLHTRVNAAGCHERAASGPTRDPGTRGRRSWRLAICASVHCPGLPSLVLAALPEWVVRELFAAGSEPGVIECEPGEVESPRRTRLPDPRRTLRGPAGGAASAGGVHRRQADSLHESGESQSCSVVQ